MEAAGKLTALVGGLGAFLISQSNAYAQAGHTHTFVTPSELNWTDVPALGYGARIAVIEGPLNEARPFTVRIKLPANFKVQAHWHPAIEHVTVMSGTFNVGMGDASGVALSGTLH
jgi:hypothetical protein